MLNSTSCLASYCPQLLLSFDTAPASTSLAAVFSMLPARDGRYLTGDIGNVEPFFFVLKPSEVRIRMPSHQDLALAQSVWDPWLFTLRKAGVACHGRWSRHYPELFQLGGPLVYGNVQDHFVAESLVFAAYPGLFYPSRCDFHSLNRRLEFLTIVVADLFVRLTEDTWEAWDCLARLAYARGILGEIEKLSPTKIDDLPPLLKKWRITPSEAFGVTSDYHRCYVDFAQANSRIAKVLGSLRNEISFGIRNLAAVLAVNFLNRAWTSRTEQTEILKLLSLLLNPSKHLSTPLSS